MTKKQCQSGNWFEYGQIDASHGRPATFLDEHKNACGNETVNAVEYQNGWNEGLKDFCSPNTAFYLAGHGYMKPTYCPTELRPGFDKKYAEGEKVWKLRKNLAELNDHLQKVEENEKQQAQNKSTFEQVLNLMQGSNVAELRYSSIVRGQRDATQSEITKLEELYTSPQMFKKPLDIESARPQLGAWVGTFVGFGSGHGIQSRYTEKGWWYTVGEIGSFFIPGGGAIIGFMGFKVWESVDVWQYNYRASLDYPDLKK